MIIEFYTIDAEGLNYSRSQLIIAESCLGQPLSAKVRLEWKRLTVTNPPSYTAKLISTFLVMSWVIINFGENNQFTHFKLYCECQLGHILDQWLSISQELNTLNLSLDKNRSYLRVGSKPCLKVLDLDESGCQWQTL